MSRRFVDERFDCGNFGEGGVVARGTVAKGDCSVMEEIPGRIRCGWGGEGVGRNTDYSEVGVLVTGAHRPKEFLDVVYCIVEVAPGTY